MGPCKREEINKPKSTGGLGIRDPKTINDLGAKTWWRWLKHPNDLWVCLWCLKYASNINQLIIWNNDQEGSLIWNAARQNQAFIQQHNFYEIKDGCSTLFWKDSWQKMPLL